jgi:uncharacterized protein (DUF433 family)
LTTDASEQVHDIIHLSTPVLAGISEKLAEMHASGRSQREIATELKVSKSWVQGALAKLERKLRHESKGTKSKTQRNFTRRLGSPPFGFDYLEDRLVENPHELRTVQKIIELWNAGHGPMAIATELNRLKLRTRKSKQWDHSLVSDIIRRACDGIVPYERFSCGLRPYRPRKSPLINRTIGIPVSP